MLGEILSQAALFQLTGVGVVETDMATGRFVRVNRTFCELVGYREAELLGMTYLELTHPDDRGRDAESFAALQRGDSRGGASVTRVCHRDGSVRWLELHVTLLEVEGGVANIAVANDVTRRNQAEEIVAANLQDMQILQEFAARLVSEEAVQTVYDEVLTAAIRLTHADAGTVQIFDSETNELVLLATNGFEPKMTDYFHRLNAASKNACGVALKTGERTLVNFDENETDEACRMHVEAGYLSAQSTPLVARSGERIGMLSTHWRESKHRPPERELRFLDLLARQAAD